MNISWTAYAYRQICRKRRERREHEIEPDLGALNLRRCSLPVEDECDVTAPHVDSEALLYPSRCTSAARNTSPAWGSSTTWAARRNSCNCCARFHFLSS